MRLLGMHRWNHRASIHRTSLHSTGLAGILLVVGVPGQAPDVQLIQPDLGPLEHVLSLNAEVFPYEQVELFARVEGYVATIAVEEGQTVRAGDELLVLSAPDLQAAVDLATAELAVAEARAQAAATELERVERALQAAETALLALRARVAATQEGSKAAEARLDLARWARQTQQLTLAEARSAAGLARAKLEQAVVFAGFARIQCPLEEAVVLRRQVDTGSLVKAGETPMLTLADVRRVRIRFYLSREEAGLAKPGTPVRVMQPPGSRVQETEIVRFHGSPRRAGAARQAEVELDNGAGQWAIGATCRVEVQILKLDRCMTLPSSAVSRGFDGSHVWIVQQGRAQRRPVETGVTVGDRVQIVSGLDGHEKLVLRPSPDLVDRGRVNARVASDYGRQLVHGESVEVRLAAAMTIGQFGILAVDLVPELINATQDRDVRVVSEAITALGMIGPMASQAIGVLDAMSRREDKQISERAKAALRLIRR